MSGFRMGGAMREQRVVLIQEQGLKNMKREEPSKPGLVKLSDRLQAIAGMVRGKADTGHRYRLCDVGTDHAHIPIRLLQEGRINSALAMDVIEGPLIKARENLELYGCTDKVMLRLSDGLDAYQTGEADGLVIAGMGGRIMGKILLREPYKTADFEELVLQPQADPEVVRGALRKLGLAIDEERLIYDDGKYYPVMHAVSGPQRRPDLQTEDEAARTECESLFGPILLAERDATLYRFLCWRKDVNGRILKSLENAQEPGSSSILQKRSSVEHMLSLLELAMSLYK